LQFKVWVVWGVCWQYIAIKNFEGMVPEKVYKCLKYHIDYLNLLTMETIPEEELTIIEDLILKHHKLFIEIYFSTKQEKYKTFISIRLNFIHLS